MSRFEWFIKNTLFFSVESKGYMAGEKVTPFRWIRAYIRFLKLSWKDI